MFRTDKKRERALEVTNPDFGGAGVEVEGTFFVNFASRIGGGKNLDADFRRASEDNWILVNFRSTESEPGDVDGFHAVSSGEWTLGQCLALREELIENPDDVALAAGMLKTRRRTHEDVAVSIRLDAIGKLGKHWISQDFIPTSQV